MMRPRAPGCNQPAGRNRATPGICLAQARLTDGLEQSGGIGGAATEFAIREYAGMSVTGVVAWQGRGLSARQRQSAIVR